MPGSGPRVDPSAYAATRQANIARAAELRAQRRAESSGGDSLDALTQDARPARKPRKEVAPGWTQHTCKKTGKSYYHHAATAKTTWTRPPGCYDERENVHPSQNDVPLQEANGRSRRRDDDVRQSSSQMSESEFESWLEVLKRRTLTGSQARRASSALARYGAAALDEPQLGRSDSLQSLKNSLRSKRGQTSETLRTKSAADIVDDEPQEEPVRRAKTEQNRRPRGRPEWNSDFATDTTADDDRRREEEEAEQQRALAQRRRAAPKPVDDLPAGWTKHVDKRTGATFYRDEAAGESTWTKPTQPARGAAPAPQEEFDDEPPAQKGYDASGAGARHRTMWKPTNDDEEDQGRWSPPARAQRQASPQKRSPVKRQASPGPAARMSPGPDNGGVPDGAANARLDDACTTCGRKMAGTALDRMEKIHGQRCCPKCAPKKARKTFNMAAKRADGFDGDERRKVLDGAKQVKKDLRQKKNSFGGSGVKEGKWKAQSNQLREAMANMRAISKAEKEGKPLPPAMPSGPDMSLIPCPHCGRRFNQKAADRHIPKCQSIKAKPKTLARGSGRGLGRR